MTSLPPLKLGFVGGSIGSAVGNAHRIASGMDGSFRLESGCFSRNSDMNRASAEAWGVDRGRTYADLFEMLDGEKGRLDAIVVLTPVHSHASIIAACLEFGYGVVSEKPLAGTVDDCRVVFDALARFPGRFALTMNYTGYPMVREFRARIQRGDFGSVHSVRLTMQQESYVRRGADGMVPRPQAWRLEDGEIPTVSLDLGAHVVHLLQFLTGEWPSRVMARMASFGAFESVIDDVDVIIESSSGSSAHAWWGKSSLGYPNGLSVEVFGDDGSAKWVQSDPEHLHVRTTNGIDMTIHRGIAGCLVAGEMRYNRFKAGHPDGFLEAFANCYHDIASCWRGPNQGSRDPYVFGVDDGTRTIEVLRLVTRAARTPAWTSEA